MGKETAHRWSMNWILVILSLACSSISMCAFIHSRLREPMAGAFFLLLSLLYAVIFLMDLSRALAVFDFGWIYLVFFRAFVLGGLSYIIYEYRRRFP